MSMIIFSIAALLACPLVAMAQGQTLKTGPELRVLRQQAHEMVRQKTQSLRNEDRAITLAGYMFTSNDRLEFCAIMPETLTLPPDLRRLGVGANGQQAVLLSADGDGMYFYEDTFPDVPAPVIGLIEAWHASTWPNSLSNAWPYYSVGTGFAPVARPTPAPVFGPRDARPRILVAGYSTPAVESTIGEELEVHALVYDDESMPFLGGSVSVELYLDRQPTGLTLQPQVRGPSPVVPLSPMRWHSLTIPWGTVDLAAQRYLFELVATDNDGHQSPMWPYAMVGVDTIP